MDAARVGVPKAFTRTSAQSATPRPALTFERTVARIENLLIRHQHQEPSQFASVVGEILGDALVDPISYYRKHAPNAFNAETGQLEPGFESLASVYNSGNQPPLPKEDVVSIVREVLRWEWFPGAAPKKIANTIAEALKEGALPALDSINPEDLSTFEQLPEAATQVKIIQVDDKPVRISMDPNGWVTAEVQNKREPINPKTIQMMFGLPSSASFEAELNGVRVPGAELLQALQDLGVERPVPQTQTHEVTIAVGEQTLRISKDENGSVTAEVGNVRRVFSKSGAETLLASLLQKPAGLFPFVDSGASTEFEISGEEIANAFLQLGVEAQVRPNQQKAAVPTTAAASKSERSKQFLETIHAADPTQAAPQLIAAILKSVRNAPGQEDVEAFDRNQKAIQGDWQVFPMGLMKSGAQGDAYILFHDAATVLAFRPTPQSEATLVSFKLCELKDLPLPLSNLPAENSGMVRLKYEGTVHRKLNEMFEKPEAA